MYHSKKIWILAFILYSFTNVFAQEKITPSPIAIGIAKNLNPILQQQVKHFHAKNQSQNGLQIDHCNIKNTTLQIFLNGQVDKVEIYEQLLHCFMPALYEYDLQYLQLFAKAKTANEYHDLAQAFPPTPPVFHPKSDNNDPFPDRNGAITSLTQRKSPPSGQNQPTGALSGKTVWLSAGHGWLNDDTDNIWQTQRGTSNQLVEDFTSAEIVNYYLQKYLYNAGANVWLVRERDTNTEEIIIDNGDSAYSETGQWATSNSAGYGNSTYRFATAAANESATAIYTPNFQKSGWYWVSIYFREGMNRCVDTQYKINHAGGESIVSINQEVHGQTWVYLGQYYFDKGTASKVILTNQSTDTGQAIIADAIRFGGGMGSIPDCEFSGNLSNRPRFEEGARQFAVFQNFPDCESDVIIRPKYAEWELAKGTPEEQANAVYLALHTNAFNTVAKGTETYSYNGNGSNPNITTGSVDLRDFIHNTTINEFRNNWDSDWLDRGAKTANFGELRELQTMPGALIEIGFHDNIDDAKAIQSPAFRDLAAKAIYKGIVRFFNNRDGSPSSIFPEKPTHLFATNNNNGGIGLRWRNASTGTAASAYKIYISQHGKAFEDGILVNGTSHTFNNLQANTTYYFKVSAVNSGGESFTTATIAAATPDVGGQPTYLLVDGFDRLDRFANIVQNESAVLGDVQRGFLERMNSFDYMVEHAQSFAACGLSFDGASNEAVMGSDIDLLPYQGVDWILGEESTVDKTLNSTEQNKLETYLNQGGNLIISGSEIGWDLGRSNSPNVSLDFYNNYLKANYLGDDGDSYNFTGTSSFFNGINGNFDNGQNGFYDVDFPDRVSPFGNAETILNYSGGTDGGAAMAYRGNDFGVVYFAFPLETVTDETVRDELVCKAVTYLSGMVNTEAIATTNFKLFPNPTSDILQIEIPDNLAEAAVELYSPSGQLLLSQRLASKLSALSLEAYAEGMYLLVLKVGDEVIGRERVVLGR